MPIVLTDKSGLDPLYVIVVGAVTGGPFQMGEIVTDESGGSATVMMVVGSNVTIGLANQEFTVNDTLTGGTSGATANINSTSGGKYRMETINSPGQVLLVKYAKGDETHITIDYLAEFDSIFEGEQFYISERSSTNIMVNHAVKMDASANRIIAVAMPQTAKYVIFEIALVGGTTGTVTIGGRIDVNPRR